jgi:DNA polymerase I-like protein with 3'-5' exonuclease and polymerase domains/uracil-DNA glycosylase
VYDPRAYGALCNRCWLASRRAGGPVPPEEPDGAKILIVGEAPGGDEVVVGRPFVGPSGRELFVSLGALGYNRGNFAISNTMLCRPLGELERMKYALGKENKRRDRLNQQLPLGEEPYEKYLHPADACRPRLLNELVKYPNIIALGNISLKAVTGSAHTITKVRGSTISGWMDAETGFYPEDNAPIRPPESKPIRILPTLHPAHVLRYRKWTIPFRGDLGRAMRWFTGRTNWRDPVLDLHPTPEALRRFLTSKPPFFAFDLETDSREPLIAKIRRFGIGTTEKVVVVPLRSTTDPYMHFYTEQDEAEIHSLLRKWITDPSILKVSWNGITYDGPILQQTYKVKLRRHYDGIIVHHCVDSELPHTLGFVGTTMTDIVAWKQDSEDPINCSDAELTERNWKDVIVTGRLKEPLDQALQLRDQVDVARKDHRVQEVCAGMHRTGLLVDPVARDEHDRFYLNQIVTQTHRVRDALGQKDFNPNSSIQLGELLFQEWGLPPVELSDTTGAPSTNDHTLRTYLTKYNLTEQQKVVINGSRIIRKAVKYRGTFLLKLRPYGEAIPEDEYALDEEETDEEREYRRKKDLKKEGILLPDGRIHASWKCHVAVTGRMACSHPNMQNWDRALRNIVVAAPGHVLVGADEDQLELRFAAAIWGLKNMLEIFKDPSRDPHSETAVTIFGEKAAALFKRALEWARQLDEKGKKRAAKKFPEWAYIRDFAKNLRYACAYGAQDEKVHEMITGTEDKDGNLIYADKTLSETRRARRALLDSDPEYEIAWADLLEEFRHKGFLAEPIWGRKRYFLDGEEPNEIYNFKVQSGCAAIVNDATFEIVEQIPFERWGPGTGLVHQGHDALVVECPELEGERVKKIMTACMTRRYPGLDVDFTAEAKIGRKWSEV